MKFTKASGRLDVHLEGPIGETCPLFNIPLVGVTEIALDLAKVTSINSIGIKQWITWTLKIPKDCAVKIENCPFMIANQASMVVGFVKPNMKITSIFLPYLCAECDAEQMRLVKLGVEYEYSTASSPPKIAIPDKGPCPKCRKETAEPDLIVEKTFKFLSGPTQG